MWRTRSPLTARRLGRGAGEGLAQIAVLLVLAAVAAGWTAVRAGGMWTTPGTMGLDLAAFLLMWTVMVTAMMLPSVAPTAALYLRSLAAHRWAGAAGFLGGYALLWAGSGILGYGLARVADSVVGTGGAAPRTFAALVFGACAVFYWSPLKYRMLASCRNPLGLVIQYGAYRGWRGHLRAGLHHGATCLACCWALMALLVVFGTMNLAAMAVITAVVAAEKLWSRGVGFARLVGVAAAVLAVAVLFVPALAVGLVVGESSHAMQR
jgi:predicted metal-binding membrane protein